MVMTTMGAMMITAAVTIDQPEIGQHFITGSKYVLNRREETEER